MFIVLRWHEQRLLEGQSEQEAYVRSVQVMHEQLLGDTALQHDE